jgi:hypothetical protein
MGMASLMRLRDCNGRTAKFRWGECDVKLN